MHFEVEGHLGGLEIVHREDGQFAGIPGPFFMDPLCPVVDKHIWKKRDAGKQPNGMMGPLSEQSAELR